MKVIKLMFDKIRLGLSLAILALVSTPVEAAAQGKILFESNRSAGYSEIFKTNPDGTNEVKLSDVIYEYDPAFNKHGTLIAFASYRDLALEIYTMKADGSDVTRLTNNAFGDVEPAFSPDGTKIAFVSDRDGNSEIYIMNANGTNQVRLTNDAAEDSQPVFSPDGTKIAFMSRRDGYYNSEIYVMNANGSNEVNLTNSPGYDFDPTYNFDGSKIAFSSWRDGNGEIYRMNPNGGVQTRLTFNDFYDGEPSYSPDGTMIAFTTYRDANQEIYIMNSDGAFQERVTVAGVWFEANYSPHWGPKRHNFRLLTLSDLISPDSEPNRGNAGSNIAIDFTVGGYEGQTVYRSAPTSQRIDCTTRKAIGNREPINRTQPDVVYNTASGSYSTTWITPTVWTGTCRRLSLNLDDGTIKLVDFVFVGNQ